jgi:hypothetical protein
MSVSFLIPAGPKNLKNLFPSVDFTRVEEYYLQLVSLGEGSGSDIEPEGTVIITTPRYKRGCCCGDDAFRLFFVNRVGQVDGIPMQFRKEDLSVKSDTWKKAVAYPLAKFDGGAQRFNVQSNETRTAENTCYDEPDQEFLKELLEAPNAWIQWSGTQNQVDDYIPVVIEDGTFETRKSEERYFYALTVKFSFANDNQGVRN